MRRLALLAGLGLAVLGGGCQTTKPIYYWGNFEKVVYQGFKEPGKASLDQQITDLKEDLEKARAKGLRVPPGLHAHLGYLYYQQGKGDLAKQAFEAEKAMYPESAAFVDRLMKSGKPASGS